MSPSHTGKDKNSGKTKAENSEKTQANNSDESEQRIPFHFHAEAHAFSANFMRPYFVPVAAQATVSLPSIGGHALSRVDNFRQDGLVHFVSARSHVSGSWQNKKIVTTHATTVIEGLNILDYILADRIIARLTSEHHVGEKEGHFVALGTVFEGLRIGGHKATVKLRHDLMVECKTFDNLKDRLAKDKEPDKISIVNNGVALCSLAEEIDLVFPGLKKRGHIIHIDHFGEIAFAEIFAAFGTRTLTMLRLKLGSPNDVTGTVGEATTNGQPMPPTPGGGSGGSN
jgi:hypothetical protein